MCPTGTNDWDKVAVGIYNDGRAEFYRAPRKLDLCCDLSWRVHFLFFLKEVVRLFESDFRRIILSVLMEAKKSKKLQRLISISKER